MNVPGATTRIGEEATEQSRTKQAKRKSCTSGSSHHDLVR